VKLYSSDKRIRTLTRQVAKAKEKLRKEKDRRDSALAEKERY
jgi:hypothetical protein